MEEEERRAAEEESAAQTPAYNSVLSELCHGLATSENGKDRDFVALFAQEQKRLNEQRRVARERERHLLTVEGRGSGADKFPVLLQGDGEENSPLSTLAEREAEIRRHIISQRKIQ